MNENQAEGKAEGIVSAAKEALGALTGKEDQAAEGHADQARGNVQQGAEGMGNLNEGAEKSFGGDRY